VIITKIREQFIDLMSLKYKVLPPEPLVNPYFPTSFTSSAGPGIAVSSLQNRSPQSSNPFCVIQPCLRYWDIPKVGDSTHLSFFEMAACGSFLKTDREKTIKDIFDFLIHKCQFPIHKLWATYYKKGTVAGISEFPPDEDVVRIWRKLGIAEDHLIGLEGTECFVANRVEPVGGYRSEIYAELFAHPLPQCISCFPGLCSCGRFLEIATSVAYEFIVDLNKAKIEKTNDFQMFAAGFGLERLESLTENNGDIWKVSILSKIYNSIMKNFQLGSKQNISSKNLCLLTDNLRSLLFLFNECAFNIPGKSNKGRRWVMNKYLNVPREIIASHDSSHSILTESLELCRSLYTDFYPFLSCDISLLINSMNSFKKKKNIDKHLINNLYL
jgi:alanyl-tRNA synthetase